MDELVERSLRRAALWDEVKTKLNRSGLELSGGQQQRLCIARTLAVEPEVILMDEPCSALDPISTARVEDLMDDLKNDYTIVIVTHNMQQARRVSDLTACLMLDEGSPRDTAPASSPSSARPTGSLPTPRTSAPRPISPAASADARTWIGDTSWSAALSGRSAHLALLPGRDARRRNVRRRRVLAGPLAMPSAGCIAAPTFRSTSRSTI